MIKISSAVNKKSITKLSNATNIFNLMKAEVNKDPQLRHFILDFAGITTCPQHIFKEIFRQMQSKLDGQFKVELKNANPMVAMSFNMAVKGKGGK